MNDPERRGTVGISSGDRSGRAWASRQTGKKIKAKKKKKKIFLEKIKEPREYMYWWSQDSGLHIRDIRDVIVSKIAAI